MSRPIWLKSPLLSRGQPHHAALSTAGRGGAWMGLPADSLELTVAAIVFALAAALAYGISETFAPVSSLKAISLDPMRLPEYAVRTVLRMLAAMGASLLFTLVYGTVAARSRRAEVVLVPLLDILQSVPVLGYLSFTVAFFIRLCAALGAGARTGFDFRDFHQPGVEHGVQLLPGSADHPARSR